MSYTKNAQNVLEIVEENNYYPFGLKHKGYNGYLANSNKYKYNGKEFQDELGLSVYDYGARNYDPALGRWMNIDPLAEISRRNSPYTYALNNPVFFIDPDGMEAVGADGLTDEQWIEASRPGADSQLRKDYQQSNKTMEVDKKQKKQQNDSTISETTEELNEEGNIGIFEFTSDYTKVPLIIEQEVGMDFSTNWIISTTESKLITVTAGATLGALSSKLGLGTASSTLLGGATALTNSYSVENKFSYTTIVKKLWYGKVTHNIFTGKITNISQTKIEDMSQNILVKVQQRVVHDFSGKVLIKSTHDIKKNIQIIHNSIPKIGMNINQW